MFGFHKDSVYFSGYAPPVFEGKKYFVKIMTMSL